MIDLSRPCLDAALLQSVAKLIGLNGWYAVALRKRKAHLGSAAQDQESQNIIEDLSAHLVFSDLHGLKLFWNHERRGQGVHNWSSSWMVPTKVRSLSRLQDI